ncbi:fatty acid desaturase [Microseira sp. BLCC-F43]|uniref:fatty acid desaturase n=1 Tax=Microseira sp. BLCC-F43 TaxID=3153602 RepID=UPI0035B82AA0
MGNSITFKFAPVVLLRDFSATPEDGGYTNPHRCQSNSLSTFWSFITCYHFGYHEEHHEYPEVPWWQLPIIRKRRIADLTQT